MACTFAAPASPPAADRGHPFAPIEFAARSCFPLVALALLAATPWLGPWTLLACTYGWWRFVTRMA